MPARYAGRSGFGRLAAFVTDSSSAGRGAIDRSEILITSRNRWAADRTKPNVVWGRARLKEERKMTELDYWNGRLIKGAISRREFMGRAAALGASSVAISTMLASADAIAAETP